MCSSWIPKSPLPARQQIRDVFRRVFFYSMVLPWIFYLFLPLVLSPSGWHRGSKFLAISSCLRNKVAGACASDIRYFSNDRFLTFYERQSFNSAEAWVSWSIFSFVLQASSRTIIYRMLLHPRVLSRRVPPSPRFFPSREGSAAPLQACRDFPHFPCVRSPLHGIRVSL